MSARPFVIGVTGNIACGKSVVMDELAGLGATTIDGDLVYRDLIDRGGVLVQPLVKRYGSSVLAEDGSISRPALADIVFRDSAALQDLDRITHPFIIAEIERQVAEAASRVVAVDGVKLIESGFAARCDAVWVVTCEPDQQRRRLAMRSGLSTEEIDRRIAAQPAISDKLAVADVVVDNSGSLDATMAQVSRAWRKAALERN